MDGVTKELKLNIPSRVAFQKFVNELNEWWPKEYTWSGDKLGEIKIDAKQGGLCTEIGPNGFRCDWGTVVEFFPNQRIKLKWQISSQRAPIPDPDRASDLTFDFITDDHATTIKLEHFNFENHGENADQYRKMMGSEQGWDYILSRFRQYCEKE